VARGAFSIYISFAITSSGVILRQHAGGRPGV
jgi:hypothetical protein